MITNIEWIKECLINNDYDTEIVKSLYRDFKKETNSAMNITSYIRRIYEAQGELLQEGDITDALISDDLVKTHAGKQRLSDTNNVIRKENRESYRLWNKLEATFEEYQKLLKDHSLKDFKIKKHKVKKAKYGIIQISDTHFNELILRTDTIDNEYDFHIGSKRLKKYIAESIEFFKFKGITDVTVILTGDLINSDRRLSEQAVKITSLTSASLLTSYLLQQAIIELSQDFNVSVASVVGNESRIKEFNESTWMIASDNWDYSIFHTLSLLFSNEKNVTFIQPNNINRDVVSLPNGFNFIIEHGNYVKGKDTQKAISHAIATFNRKGIIIHGVFTGHRHFSSIGDMLSQSSSMCGSNAYSETDLSYASRASHNCYTINSDLSYNGYKIDLMDVDNVEGYDIIDQLAMHKVDKFVDPTVAVTIKNLV